MRGMQKHARHLKTGEAQIHCKSFSVHLACSSRCSYVTLKCVCNIGFFLLISIYLSFKCSSEIQVFKVDFRKHIKRQSAHLAIPLFHMVTSKRVQRFLTEHFISVHGEIAYQSCQETHS